MPFTGFPITAASTDLNAYAFLIQLWLALRERFLAAGVAYWWPDGSTPMGQGVVPAGITATSFTDLDANGGDGWDTGGDNRWAGVAVDNRFAGLTDWTLFIDDCDHTKVVATAIVSNTATQVTYESIADYVTAGYVPSLASLEGKPYYIIRGDYGVVWADRLPPRPNDYEHASGTVVEHHDDPDDPSEVTSPTSSSLKGAARRWAPDEHAGRDLLVYAAEDGLLKRVTLTGNTRDTLEFPAQAWTPAVGSAYCVVAAGGVATPGRVPFKPFTYYLGARELVPGHSPVEVDGSYVVDTRIPAATVEHADLDNLGEDCVTVQVPAFDVDYVTAFDPSEDQLACGYPAERFFAPDIYKTLRGLQLGLQAVAPYYVEKKDYEGEAGMPLLVDALFFKAAQVGPTFDREVTDADGVTATLDAPVSMPFYPVDVYWAVLDENGDVARRGGGTLTNSTTLTDFTGGEDVLEADEGRTIVVSAGWVRRLPRHVRRMFYEKTCFLPDVDGDPPGAVDPPAVVDFAETGCNGIGRWERREVDAKYYEQGPYGPGLTDDFVAGELARYVGDNWNDEIDAADAARVPYADHFYTGRFPPAVQFELRKQRRGTPTAATATSLTDAGQDWWDNVWYAGAGGTVGRTESGTATGGSTTSLTDSTKAPTSPATEPNCAWAATRFTNFGGPYVGFTVEVLISGSSFADPDRVVEKRLITAGSAGTVGGSVSVSWAEPLSATASGKQYRIREPAYELNRWKGRTLHFTRTDGTRGTAEILGNDDTTLFFAAVTGTIDAARRYRIHEHETGGVWRWDGAAWVKPTGADAVRTFVTDPVDFVRSMTGNLPTYVTRYGRVTRGDDVASVLNQIYRGLKALGWVRRSITWDNPTSADNFLSGAVVDDDNVYDTWDELFITGHDVGPGEHNNSVKENWDLNAPSFAGAAVVPYNAAVGENLATDFKRGSWTRRANKAKVTLAEVSCPIASVMSYWVFSTVNAADDDPGTECVTLFPGAPEEEHEFYKFGFQDGPDGVLFRQYHKWDEEGAANTDLERWSDWLGDIADYPDVPDDPADDAASCLTNPPTDFYSKVEEGWYAFRAYGIQKFDVDGGFAYP